MMVTGLCVVGKVLARFAGGHVRINSAWANHRFYIHRRNHFVTDLNDNQVQPYWLQSKNY